LLIRLEAKMKKFIIGLTLLMAIAATLSSTVHAADLDAETVKKEIVGEWRLMSFEQGGKTVHDYSNDKVIWHFRADGKVSIFDKQLGQFTDTYRVVKSRYAWLMKDDIIILIKELEHRGFDHNKFVVRGLTSEGELLLGNWSDTLLYRLVRKTPSG